MHEPEVLFLDEPTTGLDPQSRLFLWDRVKELRGRGVTIVLTTHDMDEAASLADRVGIVDHGKLLALDSPEALVRELTGHSVLELTVLHDDREALLAVAAAIDGVDRVEPVDAHPAAMGSPPGGFGPGSSPGSARPPSPNGQAKLRLHVSTEPSAMLAPVVAALSEQGAALSNVHIGKPSLEDVFIHLTGRGLR